MLRVSLAPPAGAAGIAARRRWDDQVPAFAPRFRVRRGFGESTKPPPETAYPEDLRPTPAGGRPASRRA